MIKGRELEVNRRLISNRTMSFEWKEYLRQTNTQAAHSACFPNVNTLVNFILLQKICSSYYWNFLITYSAFPLHNHISKISSN